MEFKEVQEKVNNTAKKYGEEYNIKIDENFAILKSQEEFGEFIKSYIIYKKLCRPEKFLPVEEAKGELAKEMADVVGLIMVVANILNIDLEEAITNKWINRK
jgi:NTP pyrophosphatase (non-canonical NTP hydrolase)